jgi:hypothetical protein
MYLIQLLLPLYDNDKQAFPRDDFDEVRKQLADKFGGVTAFQRSPAVGLWKEDGDSVNRDDVVMFEVMTDELDENWWRDYGIRLRKKFRQDELIIRAMNATQLGG